MATQVTAVSISGTNPQTTRYQSMKYWTANNDCKLMRDYINGACSQFNFAAPWMLAVGIMENGGTGSNWMQVTYGTARDTFVNDFWAPNNVTGETAPSKSELETIDALNAVLSAYWMSLGSRSGKTNWEALGRLASAYNGWGLASSNSGITAYGWSTLFLAYGKNYTNISSYKYQGAQYSAAGSNLPSNGIVTVYSTTPSPVGATSIDVPEWTMTPSTLNYISGSNPDGKQIVLFANTDADYVSALNIVLHFYRNNIKYGGRITYPIVTRDINLATRIAKNYALACVIAVGNSAYNALVSKNVTAYSTFSAYSTPGFVGNTSTGKSAYVSARTSALAANSAGY
ncbi:MAG: hypothetical protein MSK39_02925 [Dysosmobacter sp.]|nr:hypothetical protein [Dysosmobacter sp.]